MGVSVKEKMAGQLKGALGGEGGSCLRVELFGN